MNEIYWITRLDVMCNSLEIIMFFCGISSIILLVVYGVTISCDSEDELLPSIKKAFKISITPFFIAMLIRVFIPTTKEAFMTYGVGGTIEYLKSNDKVKELPDKCIEALDAWVESLNETNE